MANSNLSLSRSHRKADILPCGGGQGGLEASRENPAPEPSDHLDIKPRLYLRILPLSGQTFLPFIGSPAGCILSLVSSAGELRNGFSPTIPLHPYYSDSII